MELTEEELRPIARHLESLGKELACPICLSFMKEPHATPCNHHFCRACILQTLAVQKRCPICKEPTTKRNLRESGRVGRIVGFCSVLMKELKQRPRGAGKCADAVTAPAAEADVHEDSEDSDGVPLTQPQSLSQLLPGLRSIGYRPTRAQSRSPCSSPEQMVSSSDSGSPGASPSSPMPSPAAAKRAVAPVEKSAMLPPPKRAARRQQPVAKARVPPPAPAVVPLAARPPAPARPTSAPVSASASASASSSAPVPVSSGTGECGVGDDVDSADVVCLVCGSGESASEGDAIVMCDGVEGEQCAVAVHQQCYGLLGPLPDGPWRCDPCAARLKQRDPRRRCALCPGVRGGCLLRADLPEQVRTAICREIGSTPASQTVTIPSSVSPPPSAESPVPQRGRRSSGAPAAPWSGRIATPPSSGSGGKRRKRRAVATATAALRHLHRDSVERAADAGVPLTPSDAALFFVHPNCAQWMAETYLASSGDAGDVPCKRSVVLGLEKVDAKRWKMKCKICGVSGGASGACIQCACERPHCAVAFHYACARDDVQHETVTIDNDFVAFCPSHAFERRSGKVGVVTAAAAAAGGSPVPRSRAPKTGAKRKSKPRATAKVASADRRGGMGAAAGGAGAGTTAYASADLLAEREFRRRRREQLRAPASGVVLLATGLTPVQRAEMVRVAGELEAAVETQFSERVTHVVMQTGVAAEGDGGHHHGGLAQKRTFKYMIALLRSKWVVSFDWVVASSACGQMLCDPVEEVDGTPSWRRQEESFAVGGDVNALRCRTGAVMRARRAVLVADGRARLTGGEEGERRPKRSRRCKAYAPSVGTPSFARSDVADPASLFAGVVVYLAMAETHLVPASATPEGESAAARLVVPDEVARLVAAGGGTVVASMREVIEAANGVVLFRAEGDGVALEDRASPSALTAGMRSAVGSVEARVELLWVEWLFDSISSLERAAFDDFRVA